MRRSSPKLMPVVPTRVSSIHALRSIPIVRAAPAPPPSAFHARAPAPAAAAPPTLHLTQPSADFNPDDQVFGPSIRNSQIARTDRSQDSGSATRRLSRTFPKRKSLNGLFGLTVKDHSHFEAVFAGNDENVARRAEVSTADEDLQVPETKSELSWPLVT